MPDIFIKKTGAMKKFIVAFDGLRFSESVRDYAIELANQSNAHLVGVFLDDFMHHSYKIYNLITENKNYHAETVVQTHPLGIVDARLRGRSQARSL